ncbi:MAG: hypothetical protein AAGF28_10780 [Pseudomonadota bacterium]
MKNSVQSPQSLAAGKLRDNRLRAGFTQVVLAGVTMLAAVLVGVSSITMALA